MPATAPSTATSAAASIPPSAPVPPAGACIEHVPEGKGRPVFSEQFPAKGRSGFVAWLKVSVEHGKGEQILPGGFQPQLSSDGIKALEQAQFIFPDRHSPTGPRIVTKAKGDALVTTAALPFVPLPKKPGRQSLELPSVPIAIARASGEIVTVCTEPHTILLEDPVANDPHAKPKRNPAGERQVEEWTLLKNLTYGGLVALAAAAVGFALARWWMKRERPPAPAAPPRPPWEVALEAFTKISDQGWIEQKSYAVHYDKVSDVVRNYLGALYGFDGLESTTREALTQLKHKLPPGELFESIRTYLNSADLVKFARVTPTEAECHRVLEQGRKFVQDTMPSAQTPDAAPNLPAPPAASSSGGPE
ncbi:MAG TPA: hypothetical protein VL137_18135 [Polyangiaceae bacterium]|nr:hypothetical protein [Polyangiaceae bacterium]